MRYDHNGNARRLPDKKIEQLPCLNNVFWYDGDNGRRAHVDLYELRANRKFWQSKYIYRATLLSSSIAFDTVEPSPGLVYQWTLADHNISGIIYYWKRLEPIDVASAGNYVPAGASRKAITATLKVFP